MAHAQGTNTPGRGGASKDEGSLSGEAVDVIAQKTALEIPERFARVLAFQPRIVQVDGFDPSVIGVTALDQNRLRVHALTQGVTTMIVTDENQKTYSVEVFVGGDARLLQAVLKRHFPKAAVVATNLRGNILLRGWVTEPQQISQIVEIAEMYAPRVINQMAVGGPQEVQLRVKVMEVQRSKIRAFGLNFAYASDSAAIASTPGPITALQAFTVPINGTPSVDIGGTGLGNTSSAIGISGPNSAFQGLLQALKEEGLLKIQAEPVLVTRSGEAARLINGGEFPIPVPQGLGTVAIEWREFGVTLESLPIVLSPTRLKQTIVAEVSERDQSSAVTISGTTVPGLTTRRVQTQAEMSFGETLVIGGLLNTRKTAETDKLPVLGDLPGIGAAFRRVRYEESEVELLVLITPEYASAIPTEEIPPGGPGTSTATPTDRELYWDGNIEVPNYGEPCEGPNCPGGVSGGHSMGTPGYSHGAGSPTPLPLNYAPPAPVQQNDPGMIVPPGMSPVPPAPATTDDQLLDGSTTQTNPKRGIMPAGFWSGNKSVHKKVNVRTPSK